MRRRFIRDESGSLMLDGMIAMLITIMLLVFLMSIGFLFYQQWMVSNIANDTATRIAQSYVYPNTDPVIGYVNVDLMDNVSLFRYLGDDLERENEDKGEKYAAWSLGISSLAYPVSDPADGLDEFPAGSQLLAQGPDMYIHGSGFSVKVIPPHMAQEPVPGEHNALVLHQIP